MSSSEIACSGTISMTAGEQALAIEEIKRLFAGRLRCMDAKEWDRYGSFHTEDVRSDTWKDLPEERQPTSDGGDRVVLGRERLTNAIRQMMDGAVPVTSVHHGHNPEIELLSDTEARGVWAMEDLVWWSHDGRDEHLHGYGHYHEEYRKVDGRWLISARRLTRIREDVTPGFFERLTEAI